MGDSKVEIKIPEDLVKQLVAAEIVSKLGDPTAAVTKAIGLVLTESIQKPGSSNWSEKKSRIEWMLIAQVESIAKEFITEFVSANKDAIRKSLADQFNSKKFSLKISEALADMIANKLQPSITTTVNLSLSKFS